MEPMNPRTEGPWEPDAVEAKSFICMFPTKRHPHSLCVWIGCECECHKGEAMKESVKLSKEEENAIEERDRLLTQASKLGAMSRKELHKYNNDQLRNVIRRVLQTKGG